MGSPTRVRILAAFTAACLQTHFASWQEKRVIITIESGELGGCLYFHFSPLAIY